MAGREVGQENEPLGNNLNTKYDIKPPKAPATAYCP